MSVKPPRSPCSAISTDQHYSRLHHPITRSSPSSSINSPTSSKSSLIGTTSPITSGIESNNTSDYLLKGLSISDQFIPSDPSISTLPVSDNLQPPTPDSVHSSPNSPKVTTTETSNNPLDITMKPPQHTLLMKKKKHRPPELDLSQEMKSKDNFQLRTPTSARNPPNVTKTPPTLERKQSADSLLRKYRSPSLPLNVLHTAPLVALPSFVKPITTQELNDLLMLYKKDDSLLQHDPLYKKSFDSTLSSRSETTNKSTASSLTSESAATGIKPSPIISKTITPIPSRSHSPLNSSPNTAEVHPLSPPHSTLLDTPCTPFYDDSIADDLFIIDTRPFTYFSTSRIPYATNVCVPSTLLKRPNFSIARFAECIAPEERAKLATLSTYSHIIVYDQSSTDLSSASSSTLTYTLLKLSKAQEITGRICYLQGGISELQDKFPNIIDSSPPNPDTTCGCEPPFKRPINLDLNSLNLANHSHNKELPTNTSINSPTSQPSLQRTPTNHISLPPVLTGFSLPAECKEMNTSKSGYMALDNYSYVDDSVTVALPETLTNAQINVGFPEWLKPITESSGSRLVARRFYEIEQAEKSRLQSAFSRDRAFSTPSILDSNGNIQYSITAGVKCAYKNRYNNIWPYDHARVVLSTPDTTASDYINASYISSDWSSRRYIATQAPLPDTILDFWSVIWDEQIPVIVMLTAEYEGGQASNTNQYWKNGIHGNRLKLTNVESQVIPLGSNTKTYVTIRKLQLENMDNSRMHDVVQIHYTDWPDLGAPASAEDLLALCVVKERVLGEWKHSHPELVFKQEPLTMVHCSAGCGRTGTFCTVDSLVDILSTQKYHPKLSKTPEGLQGEEDVIYKLVNDFRCQRKSMVQSLRQFAICYETAILWCSRELV